MKRFHVVPECNEANGVYNVARMLAREDGGEVYDCAAFMSVGVSSGDEVWVHGMWLPREWRAMRRALRSGARLVRMTHGSLSPIYLERHGKWKKKIVGPIERCFLRKSTRIIATCAAEKGWIEAYLGDRCPPIETTDLKRFFNLDAAPREPVSRLASHVSHSDLHLLYLGRRHPLKGVEYLEEAVRQLKVRRPESEVLLRIESNAFGEKKEKVWEWCDVLVLPTLSENFGLVVAEALERGKRVITTDGAPAWGDDSGEILSAYGGRLVYLKGYRDGTKERRIELLKTAIEGCL